MKKEKESFDLLKERQDTLKHSKLIKNWKFFATVPSSFIRHAREVHNYENNRGNELGLTKRIEDYCWAAGAEGIRVAGYTYLLYKLYENISGN